MSPEDETFPNRLYIPAYLDAIGFAEREGGPFIEWDQTWGIFQSHKVPRAIYDHIGNIHIAIPHLEIRFKGEIQGRVFCILFEKGYLWDVMVGWRQTRLTEDTQAAIRQHWLFQK